MNTSIATVNNTSGTFTVTGVGMGSTTITITAYKQGNSVVAATTTFTLTVAESQTGVSGGKVILNDYEDHSWSYYSDPNCPIRSLNPADVKITYHGKGTGTISNAVTIQINGGQVGTPESNANIHGGYGSLTAVTGNVTVILGASTSATDSATVNGNVFGGSALGRTNTGNTTNTTTVTMNKALINGNLFGGALGNSAVVNGKITVTVNGGRVNGNIFGGGDAAAYGPNSNHPVVNMTGGQATNVFGGGKGNTAAVTGNPQVTLSGNAHVTGNVYGGGDAAQVTGQTNVILRD